MSPLVLLVAAFLPTLCLGGDQLLFAVDVIRHGDRTPIADLPKSPYDWKQKLGTLTPRGASQEKALGEQLRKEYVVKHHLLPEHYEKGTLYVRSTDYQRTILSAESLLAGLYPDNTRPVLRENGNLPENISIEVVKKNDDQVLLARSIPPVTGSEDLHLTTDQSKMLPRWREASGLELKNRDQLTLLADHLYIRSLYQAPLPDGLTSLDLEEIKKIGVASMLSKYSNPYLSDPMGIQLLEQILSAFNKALREKKSIKYILFSGHDTSILAVMHTLGADLSFPPYASRLNFALKKNRLKTYVEITLNGKPLAVPTKGIFSLTALQAKINQARKNLGIWNTGVF